MLSDPSADQYPFWLKEIRMSALYSVSAADHSRNSPPSWKSNLMLQYFDHSTASFSIRARNSGDPPEKATVSLLPGAQRRIHLITYCALTGGFSDITWKLCSTNNRSLASSRF